MTPNEYQFHATTPEGRIQVLQLAKLSENVGNSASSSKPLVVKTQAGFQYKLIDPNAGTHLKGQKLIRSDKNLRVLLDDTLALELQDYFVASVTALPNAPVYKLENQSCQEVQVTANLPKEAFEVSESLVWTERDDAQDCKVALLNPGTALALLPAAPAAAGIGLLEISGGVVGVVALSGGGGGGGGGGSGGVTPAPQTQTTAITAMSLTHATGEMNHRLNATDTLTASVVFDGTVTVNTSGGSPTLTLLIGNESIQATYVSGSGSNTLMFTTTIVNGQTDLDGVAIASNALQLNGATLINSFGIATLNNANAVTSNPNYLVDTTPPVATLIAKTFSSLEALTGSAIVQSNETGKAYLVQSTNAISTLTDLENLSPLTSRSVTIESVLTNTDISLSGLPVATYHLYTVDLAGNISLLSQETLVVTDTPTPSPPRPPPPPPPPPSDTTPPNLTSIELTAATGDVHHLLNAGDTLSATVTFDDVVTVNEAGGHPTLAMLVGGSTVQATYVSGSGTNTLIFSTTMVTGLNDSDGVSLPPNALNFNGATMTDAAGNQSIITSIAVNDNANYLVDTTAPSVVITSDVSVLKAGDIANITFTFSEDPGSSFAWDGIMGDIAVTGGTLSALTGTGLVRIALFTPTANLASGTASVSIPAASFEDEAGNLNTAGVLPSFSLDTVAPTITTLLLTSAIGAIASPNDAAVNLLNAGDTLLATVNFSEVVLLNLTGGSPTLALLVGNSTVQATYVSGNGTNALVFSTSILAGQTDTDGVAIALNALSLNGATLKDPSGNVSAVTSIAIANNPNYLVDTTSPTVSITSDVAAVKAGETANITFTFSEAPGASFAWDGNAGDLVVSGGTLSAISGTGLSRTAVFTPTPNMAGGFGSIRVIDNSYQDDAGNNGASGTTPSLSIDTLAPLMLISTNANALKMGETATITFSFSEDPGGSFTWNGSAGDVVVTGGSLSAISGTGVTRTAVFTPTANLASGSASITVPVNAYADAAGNLGAAGLSPPISIDTLAPAVSSVALTGSTGDVNHRLNAGDTLSATLTFNDVVTVNTAVGSPTLALLVGSSTVQATYVSGSATNALVFTTTIISGQTDTDGVAIPANPLNLNGATLKDSAGNNSVNTVSAVSSNANYLVDTTSPTVAVTSNLSSLKAGDTANITFTFSEDPGSSFAWDGSVGDLVVSGGTLSAISGSNLTRTAVFTPTANLASGTASIAVSANSYQDAAGNNGSAGSLTTLNIDTVAPSLTGVALSSATGYVVSPSDATVKLLNATDTLSATVTFSEAVTLNTTAGTPTLALVIGSTTVQATYASGSDTNALVFTTTIASGQTDTDGVAIALNALTLNGATLKDATGNPSAITSIAVANNAQFVVDTTAPTLSITSNMATLKAGETAVITFTFSEDPGSSFVWAANTGDVVVSGGTLGNISGTGLTRTATFTPYANVASETASITVNAGTYTDAAGNSGSAAVTPLLTYATSTPTVIQVGLSDATGAINNLLNAGDVVFARVVFSEAIAVNTTAGTPTLKLTIGSTAVEGAYVSGSGTANLIFSYTVLAGQDDANGIAIPASAIALNGGTLKSVAGNAVTLGNLSVADNFFYPVDTTAPSVVITSSSSILKSGETSLICFTFSEDPENSFSLSDVTVTGGTLSALTGLGTVRRSIFTPTTNLGNGTASITVTDASYTDVAGNVGTAGATPSISIDTLAPSVTSVALSSATGSLNNTLNAGDTLNATVTFNDNVILNTDGSPTLKLIIGASPVYATYVSGSGTNALVFTTTIASGQTDANGVSLQANALALNGATLKDANGNTSSISTLLVSDNVNYLVDTTAPSVVIISNKTNLNSSDTPTITFTFSEDPGSSFEWDGTAGDVVVTGGSLSAISGTGTTRTAIFTPAANQASGTASISVMSSSYQDAAGNTGSAGTTPVLNLDTLGPVITGVALTSSTGGVVSAADASINNLNAGDTLSATVTFNDVITVNSTGSTPTLALAIGGNSVLASYASGSGTNALVFTAIVVSGLNDSDGVAMGLNAVDLNGGSLQDAAGNNSSITSLAVADNAHYLVDTTRPTANISSSTNNLISGQTATLTFTFTEDPGSSFTWNGTVGDLIVTGGNLSALITTGNPLTRTALLTPTSGVSGGIANVTIALNSYTDAAGNIGQEAVAGITDKSPDITYTTTTTSVASVALVSATGIQNNLLNQGDVVSVAVNFTEAVFLDTSAGTPSIGLTIGSTVVTANYVSGGGSAQLVFNYTILNGQTDVNGIAINGNSLNLNGGVLKDTALNTPTLTFVAAVDNPSYLVDTTAPTLVSIGSSRDTFLSGQTALITFTFSEDPGNTFTWDGSVGDLTLSNGTLSAISGTGLVRTGTFLPTQGLLNSTANITVSNSLFTDNAGNPGTGNALGSLVVNTSPAVLMDVQITSAVGVQNNALNAGDVVTVTAHFSDAQTLNTSAGSPTVALQIGGSTVNATYVSGSTTANLLFTYTILAGQTDADGISINANSLSLNGSTFKDPQNNTTSISVLATTDNSNYTVDTTSPFLSITSNVGQLKSGETANITFTFSEDPGNTFVWNGTTGDVTLSNGTLSAISGTGVTRTAVFTPTSSVNSGTASISISAGTYQDAAGNNGSAGGTPSLTLDTLAPTISSIALSSSTGILNTYLNEGDTANVSVTFNETVNLNVSGGLPTVALLVGSSTVQAIYVSGAGTNTLVFTTTIAAGQNDVDGIAIAINALNLNGAVLTDAAGNTSAPISSAVSSNSNYMVDTLAPNVSLSFNTASLKAGDTATLTVTINDKTGSSFSWNGTSGDLTVTGGTLGALSPFVLSGANYVSTATFTPTAGSTGTGVVSTASAVYTDLAGNPGQVGATASVAIDTTVPTLTNMNITGASGILSNTLNAGDVLQITAVFSEAVFVNATGGNPKVVLNVGSSSNSATYVSGSGTTDLLFNYTVVSGENDSNGVSYAANAMLLNGGTIKDSAGNSAVITSIARADNAAYKVDTTAPTVTVSSNMYQLLVGQTANITFTFSEDPGNSIAWNGSTGDITLSNGTLSAISGTGLTRTAVLTPTPNLNSGNATVAVTAGSYTDTAGNLGLQGDAIIMPLDTLGLTISRVLLAETGTVGVGGLLQVYLFYPERANFSFPNGWPTLDLIIGTTLVKATYVFDTDELRKRFTYTILPGQTDTDRISLVANSLSLYGGTIRDNSGNNASSEFAGQINAGAIVDTTPPTMVITSNKTTLKRGETATITFTGNESIFDPYYDFTVLTNFTFSGGTLSNWYNVNSSVKTATFTPYDYQQSVSGFVTVKTSTFRDDGGNYNTQAYSSPTILIDTQPPSVSISLSSTYLSVTRPGVVTFTFSEDPGTSFNWDGTSGDVTFSSGSLSAISGTGLTRTAIFTPTANTILSNKTIAVTASSYTDALGNDGGYGISPTFNIDSTAPKVNSFSWSSAGVLNNFLNAGDTLTIVMNADKADMTLITGGNSPTLALTIGSTVVQASFSYSSGSSIVFRYTILEGQTDTDGISINANGINYNGAVFQDNYGNVISNTFTAVSNNASFKVDTTPPTLIITSNRSAMLAGQTATITFTFSEDPGTTFAWDGTTGDVSVSGGTLGAISGTGTTRTATFTPTANTASGSAIITVAANSYQDLAGNNGAAGTTPSISIDLIAPSVAITSNVSAIKSGGTANITFTFSEDPLSSFNSSDVVVSGGTLGTLSTTGLVRTAVFTPTANLASGTASITVTALSYQDAAGNLGTAGTTPSLSIDTVAPTVTGRANSGSLIAGQTTRVYFTFSEDPGTSFTWDGSVGDLTVTGAGNLVISSVPGQQVGVERGFDFTPPANTNSGTTTISVKNASYQDAAGNLGSASGTVTISYDTLAPTVAITSNLSTVGMGQTANITFTFSEDPGSTFAWDGTTGDVVVTQGTLSAISGTGLTRTAVFTPFADTPLVAASITVAAGNYTDTAGNAGLAGTTPTLNVNTFKNAIYLDDIANNIGGYAIEAPNTGSYFGFAVSLAGDFNGDGYGDVVMGAPLNTFTDTALRTQGGGAVLYEGGLNTSLVPKGYSGTGQVNGHYYTYSVNKGWLGFSVAGVGDMNNDGLADLLIGMPQDAASSNPGGAFLVYGKANSTTGSLAEYQKDISALGTTPDALSITSTFDTAGFSVSSAGDVNGDGWIDMIISAHFQTVSGLVGNTGKTYVVYGSAALSALQTISLGNVGGTVPGFVISGWQAGEESGTSVSSAGDFNGDGKADLLVSAYFNDTAGSQAGATYVILGKTGNTAVDLANIKNNTGGFVILGENGQDMSGVSVSSGGDINGDGLGDILIGAVIGGSGNAYRESGKTYVIFGRSTTNATIDLGQIAAGNGGFAILSTTAVEQSGHSVSSAGDINGDGLADIILGAPFSPVDGGASAGRSFVVYGKSTTTNVNLTEVLNNTGGFAIIGQGAQDLSGYSVGAAGDLNGDGLADLIVGAPGYDAAHGSVQTGRSYVIFGSKTGAFAAGTAVDNTGTSANDSLTSTGTQTLAGGSNSAGTGNDTFTSSGADVLLGGVGKDTFIVNQSTITALQSNFGAGGNTTQLAKIDGGAGIDTLRLGGTTTLNLNLSLVSNTSVGNIEGSSRINSIERIDMSTNTGANELTIRAADVLDMAGSNWANLTALNSQGAGGWETSAGSTGINANVMNYHQVAVTGGTNDKVSTTGWTLDTTGNVRDSSSGIYYSVYTATSGAPAMLLVQTDIQRSTIL